MRDRLRADLRAAIKARDRTATAALRAALAALDNAEALDLDERLARGQGSQHFAGVVSGLGSAERPRDELSDGAQQAIIREEVSQHVAAAARAEVAGRADLASRHTEQARLLSNYLADTDPNDATLAAYQAAADRYIQRSVQPPPVVRRYLDRVADLVGDGHVLELGSGPGWDAAYLEQRDVHVTRSDATPAFVDRLRAAGHEARLLDVRRDEFGGPYDAVLANAVLLHLGREQLRDVLHRIREAVTVGGVLAVTLKEGDGEQWSSVKLDRPRHFTYWREPSLRRVLDDTGWHVTYLAHVEGRAEKWLHVIACAT